MSQIEKFGNSVTMASSEIAELTGKLHSHVIRDIRAMLDALKDDPVLDHVREDVDSRGYTKNFYLNRELTETLVTGYSVPLRLKVIRRLHELEQVVTCHAPAIPQTLPEALRMAADLADQNIGLRQVVAEQAPKVRALEVLIETAGAICITDAAKQVGMRPSALFQWMHENRWIYRRAGSSRWLAYQPRLEQGVLVHKLTELGIDDDTGQQKVAEQVLVTRKGLARLGEKLAGRVA
ncbi:Phage antirepressor protein YoqD, KilAC domain [Azotobacter beijerinckii]|uniref:Phage antirepressor protein YoqD, KilAC domain n=1 Tax=Azotobacter beijerinckii TaxID=170623 RepID=A0A1H9JVR2_9GAMM|nr:phage antirepressor KilAC domain-containing protein [Azotobacter beijerinckii]SEJ47168.1 Phage antirepressor protein YoqD, KilAC domain [Azotobacter beijerinckii]SEQ90625.1 Phage antirepressor protein YoqD, KilAC domain [Azotobacter beijerinckii]